MRENRARLLGLKTFSFKLSVQFLKAKHWDKKFLLLPPDGLHMLDNGMQTGESRTIVGHQRQTDESPTWQCVYFPASSEEWWKTWCISLLRGGMPRPFAMWPASFPAADESWSNQFSDSPLIRVAFPHPSFDMTRCPELPGGAGSDPCSWENHAADDPVLSRRQYDSPSRVTTLGFWSFLSSANGGASWAYQSPVGCLGDIFDASLLGDEASGASSYLYHWFELQVGLIIWVLLTEGSVPLFAEGETGGAFSGEDVWSEGVAPKSSWLNQLLPWRFLVA